MTTGHVVGADEQRLRQRRERKAADRRREAAARSLRRNARVHVVHAAGEALLAERAGSEAVVVGRRVRFGRTEVRVQWPDLLTEWLPGRCVEERDR